MTAKQKFFKYILIRPFRLAPLWTNPYFARKKILSAKKLCCLKCRVSWKPAKWKVQNLTISRKLGCQNSAELEGNSWWDLGQDGRPSYLGLTSSVILYNQNQQRQENQPTAIRYGTAGTNHCQILHCQNQPTTSRYSTVRTNQTLSPDITQKEHPSTVRYSTASTQWSMLLNSLEYFLILCSILNTILKLSHPKLLDPFTSCVLQKNF